VLMKAKLRVDKIFFSAEAIAAGYSKIMKLDSEERVAGLVHIDRDHADFINLTKGKLVFVRNIPIGAEHFSGERERHQIRFVEEVRKSLEVYRSEEIEKTPYELILTGAIDENDELKRVLGESLHITAKVFPYHKHLRSSREVTREITMARHTSFFDTISALMVLEKPLVNLIPEEIKLRKIFEEKSRDLFKAGILAMTLIVLFCGLLISRIYFKDTYLNRLNQKYGLMLQQAEHLMDISSKVDTVKHYLRGRGRSLLILEELYSLIPVDVYFTNIRLDQQGRLAMEGKSRAMAVVFVMSGDMEESKYFENVELRRTTKRKEAGAETLVDFELTCMVSEELI
ncbi:PilN domain-containing protein, partial [Candidatus Omnitrophota bacterium]